MNETAKTNQNNIPRKQRKENFFQNLNLFNFSNLEFILSSSIFFKLNLFNDYLPYFDNHLLIY